MYLDLMNLINEFKMKNKSILESPVCSVWDRSISFSNFLTAPMHLLYLGITKILLKTQAKVVSLHKVSTEYKKYIEKRMSMIISYVMLISITEK